MSDEQSTALSSEKATRSQYMHKCQHPDQLNQKLEQRMRSSGSSRSSIITIYIFLLKYGTSHHQAGM